MTSETFVFGGPVSEKVAIGARVRRYAESLGAGHVEAAIKNYGDRVRVVDARAFPLTARDYGIQRQLERHLNGPDKSTSEADGWRRADSETLLNTDRSDCRNTQRMNSPGRSALNS